MKTISIARRLGVAVVALAGVLALAQPIPAEAAHGGGLDGSWGGGSGWDAPYYDYGHDYGYPDYGSSGYSQPHASQYWYYCQNPSGYYPYVQQCSTNWQPVPA